MPNNFSHCGSANISQYGSANISHCGNANISYCDSANNTFGNYYSPNNLSDVVEYHITQVKFTCDIVNAAILLTVMPVILGGNFMVTIAVIRFRKLRTSMNMLIASLAIADILVGFPSIPLYVVYYIKGEVLNKFKYLCLTRYASVVASMSGSIISLTFVSLDRYIAVIHPLKYPTLMTKRRVKFMLLGIWTYDIVFSVMPLLGVNVWRKGMPCLFFVVLPKPYTIFTVPFVLAVCLISSVSMYAAVFRVAKQHHLRMKKINVNSARKLDSNRRRMDRETRTAKIMAFVLLLFFIFWFPFLATSLLKYLPFSKEAFEIAKTFSVTLAMTNSAVNPFIYCWLRRDFRKAFKIMICCNNAEQKQKTDMKNAHGFSISWSLCSSDTSQSIERNVF